MKVVTRLERRILIICILASFVAFLDGTVVNVALPTISRQLGGGLTTQQWVVDAYLLSLGSLILLAGSLSDLFGRKLILFVGLLGFGIASVLCAVATTSTFLIVSRALQGVAGALLVPSSLALIISTFKGKSQAKAIGTWTAWASISSIVGPLVGGYLVDSISWRAVFLINLVPIAVTLWLLSKLKIVETIDRSIKVDYLGALLCTIGLCLTVFSLIEQPHYGWDSPSILLPLVIGLTCLASFVILERRVEQPMLPLSLFKVRNFSFGNLATICIYSGLSAATFLIVISLQQLGGYSALKAGVSLLPITLIMFFLSPRFGALAGKYGPRTFMSVGPILTACGSLLLIRSGHSFDYLSQLLPGIILFGIGLSMTVSPLTSAILGDIPSTHSGIGSAVNNALSRIAGLFSIAAIGLLVGGKLSVNGFHKGLMAMAVTLTLGGVISFVGIRTSTQQRTDKT
jgi:EmrB/QacA subfamily drug resistance transporter